MAIIGGGPAGLLAAIAAAEHGAAVTLLEKNDRLGAKMLLSGGGRCNITNTGDVNHLVQSFPGNGKFLYHAFSKFTSRDILDLLAEEGVATREEEKGRVFPASDDAGEVVEALARRAYSRGVNIRLDTQVVDILRHPDKAEGFQVQIKGGEVLEADKVIICTGGVTYPQTGSTGDGYTWASRFGHHIVTARPAMAALETVEEWPARVQGVTLKNVEVVVRSETKVVTKYCEDVLFTHFGLSGPAIINISGQAAKALEEGPVKIGIRTDSDLRADDWEARLQMALREHPRQLLKSLVARWWPASLAEVLLEVHGIPPEVMANQVTKVHRRQTAELLDEFTLQLKKARPLETAMVTAGGVDTNEVDPYTMQSRLVKGLFFAGEILDVNGISGGYNLQEAYSTGYLAGSSAAGAS
ncbi:MAG TPA: NAD(P)/FAD-dependent oxidoreductase [Firmicutes bacterium]|nr:NAD(P)/FAD-dependent oxidoreductase [Bacillota bacterium]